MTVVSAQEEEDSQVEVEIDDTVELDVKPNELNYGVDGQGLEIGEQTIGSDEGDEHIEVANIGSDRLDQIYIESDMPTEQPFATESEVNPHNAGNFVVMSLDTFNNSDYDIGGVDDSNTSEEFHFINRVEYYEENEPQYLEVADSSSDIEGAGDSLEEANVGRFRVQDTDYWFVYYDIDGADEVLKVARTPETDFLGTRDFTESGDDYILYDESDLDETPNQDGLLLTGQEIAVPADDYDSSDPLLDINGEVDPADPADVESERNYNLYVDNEFTIRTRFNIDQDNPEGTWDDEVVEDGAQRYILDAEGTESNALQPDENFPIDFGVEIPNGVDHTAIDEGTVTLNAEAFE